MPCALFFRVVVPPSLIKVHIALHQSSRLWEIIILFLPQHAKLQTLIFLSTNTSSFAFCIYDAWLQFAFKPTLLLLYLNSNLRRCYSCKLPPSAHKIVTFEWKPNCISVLANKTIRKTSELRSLPLTLQIKVQANPYNNGAFIFSVHITKSVVHMTTAMTTSELMRHLIYKLNCNTNTPLQISALFSVHNTKNRLSKSQRLNFPVQITVSNI